MVFVVAMAVCVICIVFVMVLMYVLCTGKTCLIAKLASLLASQERPRPTGGGRPVITRFCGTSDDSPSGLKLVRSICKQILYTVSPDKAAYHASCSLVPDTYAGVVKCFHGLVAQHAVVILIDSLRGAR